MLVYVNRGAGPQELQLPAQYIGRGASGTIYRLNDPRHPDAAAKIYHQSAELESARIEFMIANPPKTAEMKIGGQRVPSLAWPTHFLYDKPGKVIGYIMPFVDRSRAVTMQVYVEDINMLPEQDQSISLRMTVGRNLAALLAQLHAKRDFVIDLKPENILVFKETGNIALLDCDGFALDGGRFPAPQYTPQYQGPEVLINRASPQSLSLNDYHDRFALAVNLFRILNYGTHPFEGVPADMSIENADSSEYLKRGWYAYGLSPCSHLHPPPRSIHRYWDDGTLMLFNRAFTAGLPSERPTAGEWRDHFDRLLQSKPFKPCNRFATDVRHLHFCEKPCFVCEKFMKPDKQKVPVPGPLQANPQNRPAPGQRFAWMIGWAVAIFIVVVVLMSLANN